MHVRRIFAECLRDIRCIFNLLSRIMFATYSLNIRRLLTQSIRGRPNLHVKSEHPANILRILVSHLRLCLPNNRRVFASCSQKLFEAVHFFSVRVVGLQQQGGNHTNLEARAIHDELCDYFNTNGQVPWQWSII